MHSDAPLNSSQGLGDEPMNGDNEKVKWRKTCDTFLNFAKYKKKNVWELHNENLNDMTSSWTFHVQLICTNQTMQVVSENEFNLGHGLTLDSLPKFK
jgi:hypothetical protein